MKKKKKEIQNIITTTMKTFNERNPLENVQQIEDSNLCISNVTTKENHSNLKAIIETTRNEIEAEQIVMVEAPYELWDEQIINDEIPCEVDEIEANEVKLKKVKKDKLFLVPSIEAPTKNVLSSQFNPTGRHHSLYRGYDCPFKAMVGWWYSNLYLIQI